MQNKPFRPLGDLLRDTVDDEMIHRMTAVVETNRRLPKESLLGQRPLRLALATGALTFVFGLGLWFFLAPQGPITVVGGSELERISVAKAADGSERFELSDGSSLELEPGTELTAEVNTGRRVALRIEGGKANFNILPSGSRRWSIDAGVALVEVIGTQFSIESGKRRVVVSVVRGQVRVLGETVEGGSRLVGVGEQLVIRHNTDESQEESSIARNEATTRSVDNSRPEPQEPPQTVALSKAPRKTGYPAKERNSWRQYATQGDYSSAYNELGSQGLRSEVEQAESIKTLLSLADVARLSGHPRDAIAPLEKAMNDYPSDRRASVAAFTLGRIEADHMGRHRRAARAFRRCLELGAPQALREDASHRLVLSSARTGDLDGAEASARDYLRWFPNGRHATEVRRWVRER